MVFIGALSPKSACIYYDCVGGWRYGWNPWDEYLYSGYQDATLCSGYHDAYVDGKHVMVKEHSVLSGDIVAPVVHATYYDGYNTSTSVGEVLLNCEGFEGGPTSVTVPEASCCSFRDCHYLEKIKINKAWSNVRVSNCANLKSVDFEKVDGGTEIKEYNGVDHSTYSVYVNNCNKLTELNVKTGESWKVENCNGLKSIQINNPDQNMKYLFIKDCASLEELIISSDCEYVRVENCPNLKKVMIPNYTSFVFAYFKNLKDVTIPQGVEKIGDHAFLDCKSLTSINLPKSIKEIGSQAFRFTSVRDVYYAGTKAEWENVTLYGEIFDPQTVIHCSDGDYDLCKCNCHKGAIFRWFYEIIAAILEVCGFDSHCRCGNAHR
jgi:hypothetical protein